MGKNNADSGPLIPYGGKFSREKIFTKFAILEILQKIISRFVTEVSHALKMAVLTARNALERNVK